MGETNKFYCVENYKPGEFVTKGRVYQVVCKNGNDYLLYDSWESPFAKFDIEEYRKKNPDTLGNCLVPLVKRPAKVGEWVYVTANDGASQSVVVGNAYKVIFVYEPSSCKDWARVEYENSLWTVIRYDQYLVLDNYHLEQNEGKSKMTKQEQLQALQEQIAKLTAESVELEKQIEALPWVPKEGEKYYLPLTSYDFCDWNCWEGDCDDEQLLRSGQVYRTAEEAIEAGKRMYYRHWAESMSDVTEEMKKDGSIDKYTSYWHYRSKRIHFGSSQACYSGEASFTTKEALQEAIATIGEDNWIKYVLGVQR